MNAHITVLCEEAVQALSLSPDDCVIDGTFGRGGHSQKILNTLGPKGRLIGIDKDLSAVKYAQENIQDPRFKIIHSSFAEIFKLTQDLNLLGKVNAVLLDLGVSSPQIDQAERGMSFMKKGPLDMRMDQTQGITCQALLEKISEEDLATILFKYGDEKFSRRIAKAIITKRTISPITTTQDLAEIISEAMPIKDKHKHPATRSFQALRIYLNKELEDLENFLNPIEKILAPGGRLGIISFHSLEDRIVKNFFHLKTKGPALPRDLPIKAGFFNPSWELVDKKNKRLKPSEEELENNHRSRSALLRVGIFKGAIKNNV